MEKEYIVTNLMVSSEERQVLVVKSMAAIDFEDVKTIIERGDEGQIIQVYTTEGYLWKSYGPEETDGVRYAYWFLLAKDQGAGAIANQLAEEKAALQRKASGDSKTMSE